MPSVLEAKDSLQVRIRARRPRDLPLSAYLSGWLQAGIQMAAFFGSLWLLQGETHPVAVLGYSLVFGWAWFCLLMVGHDAMHQSFFPSRRLNQFIAFLTLDCLLFSRASWIYGHNVVHHGRPYSAEDGMYLRGDSIASDLWNLLKMVLTYIAWDVTRLVERPTWHEWLGMLVRLMLFWVLLPIALLPAILFLLLCGNYLGLLSHALPVGRTTQDPVLRQLRTTWDLYPESFFASLLTGGLNAHATHHVYPSLPRGAQPRGSRILREEAGSEHRSVDTLAGIWTLFRLRRYCTSDVAAMESIIAARTGGGLILVPNTGVGELVSGGALAGVIELDDALIPVKERRVTERRVQQVPISFPERREGDRREGLVASPR